MQRMQGAVLPYAWGSTTTIPRLLRREPTGEPQAELWLGAHPAGASALDGVPLDTFVAREPERYVGAASVARFGPRLPYLLKVLAAARPLSLQAHPTRAQAEAGYAREQRERVDQKRRIYSDDWPKPETLCALENFEALCGFRPPPETYELFAQLGAAAALELVGPLREGGATELEAVFARVLRLSEPGLVLADVLDAARRVTESSAGDGLAELARTAIELADGYPDDPGVLAALLLNRVRLARDEALYLPAGNLHSYLRGSGIEIMANSDNVLRGGLTSKHVAVEELLRIIDFTPGPPTRIGCVEEGAGVCRYQAPAPEFALWRLEPTERATVPGEGSGRVLLVVEGHLAATSLAGASLTLQSGDAAFLTADDQVEVEGGGRAFLGASGA